MLLKICFELNWTFSTLSIELAWGLQEWVSLTRSIQEPNRPAGTGTTGRERWMPCNSRGPWGLSSDSRGGNRGQRHIPRQNGCQWRWKAPTLSHDILLRVSSPICPSVVFTLLRYNERSNFEKVSIPWIPEKFVSSFSWSAGHIFGIRWILAIVRTWLCVRRAVQIVNSSSVSDENRIMYS